MATDNSTLEISVITTGLSGNGGAPAQLNRLAEAAASAEPKVKSLLATVEKLMGAQKTGTATALEYAKAIQSTTSSLTGSTGGADTLAAATTKLAKAMLELSVAMTKIKSNSDSATKSIVTNTGAMSDAHAMARGLTGSLGALWITYGSAIPLITGLAIGSIFKSIVSLGAEVEHTLESIRVRGQETVESIAGMRDVIMTLGKGMYGPKEVAEGFNVLILAGLNAKQSIVAINDALNLAAVGGTTIQKSAEVLVQVGNALNIDAAAYSRIADVITMTADVSIASVESISESFKIGSAVGKLYGVTLVDIGTQFAILSNLGIKGTAAGTAVKNLYSVWTSGAPKVVNAFKQIGLSLSDLQDASGKMLGIDVIAKKIQTGLDGNISAATRSMAISNLANMQGRNLLTELLAQTKQAGAETATALTDIQKKIQESYGYAAIGAAAMALTIQSQFKAVKNTLETDFLGAFQDIQPQLSVVATQLKSAFNSDEFKTGIQNIALAIADLGVLLAENISNIKLFVEGFLAYKAISFVSGVLMGIGTAAAYIKEAFVAARLASIAFQVSLGILGVALLAAGAAWAWYHEKKDEAAQKTQVSIQYMNDFTEKLKDEAVRLETQLDLMRKGKTAREAETITIQQQQLALVALNGVKAVSAAQGAADTIKYSLTRNQLNAYDAMKAKGATSGSKNADVDALLAAEGAVAKAVRDTTKARTDAEAGIKRLNDVSKSLAEEQEKQSKAAQVNADGPKDFVRGSPKKARVDTEAKKIDDEFIRRAENLQVLIRVQEEMTAGMALYGLQYEKAGPGLKNVYKIEYEMSLLAGTRLDQLDKTKMGYLETELALAKLLAADEAANTATKKALEDADKEEKSLTKKIEKVNEEADAAQRKADAYLQLKGTSDVLLEQDIQTEANAKRNQAGMEKTVELLDKLAAAYHRRAIAKGNLGIEENNASALATMDKFLDPKKAIDFGNSMKDAFGKVGEGIDKMAKSYDDFSHKQEKLNAMAETAKNYTGVGAAEKSAAVLSQVDKARTKSTLDMYAMMATGAKDFFGKNTAAYKIMGAVEQAIRLTEIAMTLESFAVKQATTTAAIALWESEGAAAIAVDSTVTGVSIGNSIARGTADAAAGAAKIFAWLGPWGFAAVAAMAAVLATFGLSSGGGGAAPDTSAAQQKSQGTGTVLGSQDAKSSSIADAIGVLTTNSSISLQYTSSMLVALNKIKDGIGGLATFVAQTSGLRGTAQDTAGLGLGATKGFLGFSSSSTSLTDSGLLVAAGQTIGSVISQGIKANSYQDVNKQSSSFFGLFNSNSNSTNLGGLDSSLTSQLVLTVKSLSDGVQKAAGFLGVSGSNLVAQLNSMSVDIGKISFKGLSGADIQAQLEAVFGKLGDQMAALAAPTIGQFQKVGEGYFQTLVRVSTGVDFADHALSMLGITAINFTQITNKQGDVAAEIVRQSLLAKEGLSGVGNILQNLSGDAQSLIDTYKLLAAARTAMMGTGLGNNLTANLITAAGGLDVLQASLTTFKDKFFTDSEKLAMDTNTVAASFNALGLRLPANNTEFKNLVISLSQAGAGSQVLLGKVLGLTGAFEGLSTLATSTTAALVSTAQTGVDTARNNLTTAYQNESAAITTTQTKFASFAASLKTFQQSLTIGALSPLNAVDKYAFSKSKFDDTAKLAATGDTAAIAAFQTAANDFLNNSRIVNASSNVYTDDFNRVQAVITDLAKGADSQVSVAQQSLDALKSQVNGLITINASVLSVHDAIIALQTAQTGLTTAQATTAGSTLSPFASYVANSAPLTPFNPNGTFMLGGDAGPVNGSHANGLGYVPFDGYRAELHKGEAVLTASENKSYQMNLSAANDQSMNNGMRDMAAELAAIKAEIRKQTGTLVSATYDSQDQSSKVVVDGIGGAVTGAARRNMVGGSKLN